MARRVKGAIRRVAAGKAHGPQVPAAPVVARTRIAKADPAKSNGDWTDPIMSGPAHAQQSRHSDGATDTGGTVATAPPSGGTASRVAAIARRLVFAATTRHVKEQRTFRLGGPDGAVVGVRAATGSLESRRVPDSRQPPAPRRKTGRPGCRKSAARARSKYSGA